MKNSLKIEKPGGLTRNSINDLNVKLENLSLESGGKKMHSLQSQFKYYTRDYASILGIYRPMTGRIFPYTMLLCPGTGYTCTIVVVIGVSNPPRCHRQSRFPRFVGRTAHVDAVYYGIHTMVYTVYTFGIFRMNSFRCCTHKSFPHLLHTKSHCIRRARFAW